MSWKEVKANCGCIIEMDLSHDWESGTTDAEDVSILKTCDLHTPNKYKLANWTCDFCGYVNDGEFRACYVCKTDRK